MYQGDPLLYSIAVLLSIANYRVRKFNRSIDATASFSSCSCECSMHVMRIDVFCCDHIFPTGTDPPDMIRTPPCAVKESWIDPRTLSVERATESIGQALQEQYKTLQPRRVPRMLSYLVELADVCEVLILSNPKSWHTTCRADVTTLGLLVCSSTSDNVPLTYAAATRVSEITSCKYSRLAILLHCCPFVPHVLPALDANIALYAHLFISPT